MLTGLDLARQPTEPVCFICERKQKTKKKHGGYLQPGRKLSASPLERKVHAQESSVLTLQILTAGYESLSAECAPQNSSD
jgi:hypothetical protein